jgi:hypothetical protein
VSDVSLLGGTSDEQGSGSALLTARAAHCHVERAAAALYPMLRILMPSEQTVMVQRP